jgi:hypothetical protein
MLHCRELLCDSTANEACDRLLQETTLTPRSSPVHDSDYEL